jgi:hypothetical protein
MSNPGLLIPVVFILAASGEASLAQSDAGRIQALEHQVERLEARISLLEASRTFTSFMPNFAERFHVMHHAGEAGDWAVASHELQELLRLSAQSTSIDAEKGAIMQGMMAPSFEALEKAIEHGNQKTFGKALAQTIETCNACHAATGSGFVEVTLDVDNVMSLRHPHKLTPRAVPEGHTHGTPPKRMGKMMHDRPSGGRGHDDRGKPAHTD